MSNNIAATSTPELLPGTGNPYHEQSKYYARLVLSVTWVEIVLVLAMFSCQTITNWKYTKRFRADYWVALFTLVRLRPRLQIGPSLTQSTQLLGLGGQGMETYSVVLGLRFGRSLALPPLEQSLKYGWLAMILSIIATTTGKVSIICFLNQVRGHHRRRQPWFLYFIGLSNILIDTTTICLLITQCSPVSKLWSFTEAGTCGRLDLVQGFAYLQGGK